MHGIEFYERLMGLTKPWIISDIELDLENNRVVVQAVCMPMKWKAVDGSSLEQLSHDELVKLGLELVKEDERRRMELMCTGLTCRM